MIKKQEGMTLMELMFVIATIGVLVSIALPAYQSYTIRAQVAEGIQLSGPLQLAISEYRNDYGRFPVDNAEAGLSDANTYNGSYVSSILVNGDIVSIRYGNSANAQISGGIVTLQAVPNRGSVQWECGTDGTIPESYLPPVCRA